MVNLSSFSKCVALEDARQFELFSSVEARRHPLCDVLLRVPGSESEAWVSIGSNSALLRMKSSVFEEMWESESGEKGVETIHIADCSEAAIRALNAVAFGQLAAVQITAENVAELLYAALKYDFKLVADCCQQFVDDAIANDDANEWLPVVSALCKCRLKEYASNVVAKSELFGSKKTTAAFECDAVTTLPLALFRDLLKDDCLRLSEEVIWEQCVKWANRNCGESVDETEEVKVSDSRVVDDVVSEGFVQALSALKEFIRFPLMSLEFFSHKVAGTGLLSDAEVVAVMMAATKSPSTRPLFCCSKPRIPVSTVPIVFDCFEPRHFEVKRKGAKEVLRVTGDRRALFGSSKAMRTGIHNWELTIDECNGNLLGFGVSQNCAEYKSKVGGLYSVDALTYLFWGNGYYFSCQRGDYRILGSNGAQFRAGDRVQLALDCGNWTLTAVHNATVARKLSLEKDKDYFPVVCSFGRKDTGLVQATVQFFN